MKNPIFYTLLTIVFLSTGLTASAGDLDDGINPDELINDDLNLDVNIQYIQRRAKAAAQAAEKGQDVGGKIIVNSTCGTGNQNFGVGVNLKGATIVNLSNNKGARTVCTQ